MALALSTRSLARPAGALLLTLAAACGDPTDIEASFETIEETVTVYALSGTPTYAPTGVVLVDVPAAVRIGPDYSFDLALDFVDGSPRLYPVQLIASDVVLGSTRRVGLQEITGTSYDELLRAPNTGYTFDEPLTLAVGDVGVIESVNHPFCSFSILRNIYGKFVVEAVDPATRSVRLTITSDPNCGFRGFEEGFPSR